MAKTRKNIAECDGGAAAGGAGGAGGAAAGGVDAGNAPGISTVDVLGKCDHESGKGYLGPGCFHVPTNVLQTSRTEIPSKKKKGHKNPYAKGAAVIGKLTENQARRMFEKMCSKLDESSPVTMTRFAALRRALKTPSDLCSFVEKHRNELEDFRRSGEMNTEQEAVFSQVLNSLEYAVGKGIQFIEANWWKTMLLTAIILAVVNFRQVSTGIGWGLKLFGTGFHATEKHEVNLSESVVPVISDQTIDAFSAKYYCMFADRNFQQKVEEIKTSPKYRKMADSVIRGQISDAKTGDAIRLDEFIAPVLVYPALASAVEIIGGMVAAWMASGLATDAVVSATKNTGTESVAHAIEQTSVHDLGTVSVEASRLPGTDKNSGFWKKFLKNTTIGSAFTTVGTFIAKLLGLAGDAAEKVTVGLVAAAACGCAALVKHLVPVFVSWFRKLRETGVIAAVEFESNGDGYRMSYSVKDGKWRMYLLGSRLFSRHANPTSQELQQVMNTKFFKSFHERCSSILHTYLDDPSNVTILTTLVMQNEKDPDMKYAKDVLLKKDEFLARFDSPTFVTESTDACLFECREPFPETLVEADSLMYSGDAKIEFDKVVGDQPDPLQNVLYYNPTLRLAWMIKDNGELNVFKPVDRDNVWTVYATRLRKDAMIEFIYKAGRYSTENAAVDAIYRAAEDYRKRVETVNETGYSAADIVNWEAHGRDPRYFPRSKGHDVNVRALIAELKQKFRSQFRDISLRNLGGTWEVILSVVGLTTPLSGQARVRTAVPRINDIISLLRIRGVQTNPYNVKAMPA